MKTLIILALTLISTMTFAGTASDALLDAIADVESLGQVNRSRCIGDNGKARGMYQLHKEYIEDVNRFAKTSYTWADAFNPSTARKIVKLYIEHYSSANASDEDMARIHNGGPRGHRKSCTLGYWTKINKYLSRA